MAVFSLAVRLLAREKNDVLITRNGDRITCKIKGLASDTLYIKFDYILGTSSVEVDHVESKQLFIVKTQDRIVYTGALSAPRSSHQRPVKIQTLDQSHLEHFLLWQLGQSPALDHFRQRLRHQLRCCLEIWELLSTPSDAC